MFDLAGLEDKGLWREAWDPKRKRRYWVNGKKLPLDPVTGNKLAQGGKTTFKAFFKPSGLIIVHATTAYENGDNRITNAYYDKAQPFYTIARTTHKFEGDTQLQIFFDATGKLTYSRFQKDGALAPMPEGEAQELVRRTRNLASDAIQARGPGHKIGFDLGALNELGLTGPPLR